MPVKCITGQRWLDVLAPLAQSQQWGKPGAALKMAGLPWPVIRIGALVVPTWAALLEMHYLWQTPHALANDKLAALIGPEPSLYAAAPGSAGCVGRSGAAGTAGHRPCCAHRPRAPRQRSRNSTPNQRLGTTVCLCQPQSHTRPALATSPTYTPGRRRRCDGDCGDYRRWHRRFVWVRTGHSGRGD